MAPLLVGKTVISSAGGGTASDGYKPNQTITRSVTTGNVLFLTVTLSGNTPTVASVSDTAGNTWTRWDLASINGVTANQTNQGIDVWTAKAVSTASITVTVTPTASSLIGLDLREYSGLPSTSYLGAATTSFDTNYVQAHGVGGSINATSGDLIVAVINSAHTNEVYGAGGDFANQGSVGAATGLQYLSSSVWDRIATTNGTQNANFSSGGYDKAVMSLAVLKNNVTTPPNPPTNVLASAGDASVALSWTAPIGATSYTVRQGTSASTVTTVAQSGVTNTGYTITGLTNGTPYSFSVSAVNTIGESAQVATAAVTPKTAPAVVFSDWYANGTKPNISAPTMRATFRTSVDTWFKYVLTAENQIGVPIPPNPRLPGPVMRIQSPNQGFYPDNGRLRTTVSEGQGYGALFCAWLSNPALPSGTYWANARATFDALYRYYDVNKNSRGLMNWHIYDDGSIGDTNGATDGDLDMAEALRVMSCIHGNTGTINYGAEADALMKAIEDYEFVPETGYAYPNLMTPGDGWGFNTDITMCDYSRVGYWKEWQTWLGLRGRTSRAARWGRIIDTNMAFMNYYITSPSWSAGVPDRQTRTHTTYQSASNDKITYNSPRLGFGISPDHLWHGANADPRSLTYSNIIANKIVSVFGTAANVKALDWSGDLSSSQGYSNSVAYSYALSVMLGSSANQAFATDLFNIIAASSDLSSNYFNGGIICYALGVASGAAQPFTSSANTTAPETGTTTGGGTVTTPPVTSGGPLKQSAVFSVWDGTQYIQLIPVTTVS